MTAEQMALEMVMRLNRPQDDDLFVFPDEYYSALSRAHTRFRKKVAEHRPELIYQSTTLTSSDGGDTFTLTDSHLGEMLLFFSPGPPRGRPLRPATPEGVGDYWQEGLDIKMIRSYNDTLYVRWVPSTVANLDGDASDSTLPGYCDEAIIWWACYLMSKKPGFLGNPETFKAEADREWRGDDNDPSDMGILGTISRQSAHQAWEGVSDEYEGAWWRGIR
ncbi:MAG: hypothetical protein ACYS7M_06220 [Planctomycetota bacterium]|jgi:hypothetical protein